MIRLTPDTIAARTLLVLIIGLTVSHVLSMALYFTDRSSALMFTGGEHISARIATISRLARNASQDERQRIAQLADSPNLRVSLSQEGLYDDRDGDNQRAHVLREALSSHLNDGENQAFRLRYLDADEAVPPNQGPAFLISIRLPDKDWLNFIAPVEPPKNFWSFRFAFSIVVMLIAVGVLAAFVVNHFTRPIVTFARAAHRLGVDVRAPPMSVSGPVEVRQAAQAFNQMQERIRRFVDDRTQMIAAISHDLGTPITRLRLRAEFIEDPEEQRKMLADLDDMEKMVSSALSLARNESSSEPYEKVDLRTLLQRVSDDMADAGLEVSLDAGDEAVPFNCRPAALRRALTNLIDNAARYGHRARISLENAEENVRLRIDDDGPGIPEDLHEEVFKPFKRLEASRSRETGGTGLGLTVARTIVHAHGGEITFRNRSQGGLRVEIILPH
jgi:signal transduction histidine kinase